MTVFLFVSLLVMLAASVPIFIALCGSVTASFLLFSNMDTTIIIQRMFAGINKFSLMSIPLFVLAANLMSEGGISKRIINLAHAPDGFFDGNQTLAPGLSGLTLDLRMTFCVEKGIYHKAESVYDTCAETGHKQGSNRSAGYSSVNDHVYRRWDDDTQRACRGDDTCGELLAITLLDHRRV